MEPPQWNPDEFLPQEVADHFERRDLRTDGLGLVQSSWGVPILLTDEAYSLLAHRSTSQRHQWAGSLDLQSNGQFKVILDDSAIGFEIKARRDWKFTDYLADIAKSGQQVELGRRQRPESTSLNEKLRRFSILYEEWRNYFGYLRDPQYDQQGLAMLKRKQELEQKMDALCEETKREIHELPET